MLFVPLTIFYFKDIFLLLAKKLIPDFFSLNTKKLNTEHKFLAFLKQFINLLFR
jgi:hypothetical protein